MYIYIYINIYIYIHSYIHIYIYLSFFVGRTNPSQVWPSCNFTILRPQTARSWRPCLQKIFFSSDAAGEPLSENHVDFLRPTIFQKKKKKGGLFFGGRRRVFTEASGWIWAFSAGSGFEIEGGSSCSCRRLGDSPRHSRRHVARSVGGRAPRAVAHAKVGALQAKTAINFQWPYCGQDFFQATGQRSQAATSHREECHSAFGLEGFACCRRS